MRKPKMLPLRFPYAPGSTCGVVGSLETCSARVYQSSRKFSEAVFAALQVTVGDWEAFFKQKLKLDYGNTQ